MTLRKLVGNFLTNARIKILIYHFKNDAKESDYMVLEVFLIRARLFLACEKKTYKFLFAQECKKKSFAKSRLVEVFLKNLGEELKKYPPRKQFNYISFVKDKLFPTQKKE